MGMLKDVTFYRKNDGYEALMSTIFYIELTGTKAVCLVMLERRAKSEATKRIEDVIWDFRLSLRELFQKAF